MSRTLSIPVRQTITLPDNWQACRTPQELSYWLISQFDEFEHEVETLAADIATLQGDVDNLEDTVSNIDARLVVVEGQINNPTDGILATLAALAAADAEINAHLDDTDHNVSSNAAGIYQLNVDVTAINADLVNIHDVLVTYGSDISDLDARVTALENAGGGSSIDFVEAATISADYAIPAPTDAGLKNLRYYYVDDGASSYTLTIASALATYMKANGVKTEIFADESGSGYLTLDLTAISSIMRSTSVDGKTLSSLLTDLATYAAPKKITFWGDGTSLSWSAVDMTVQALAGKYLHKVTISFKMQFGSTANERVTVKTTIPLVQNTDTAISNLHQLYNAMTTNERNSIYTASGYWISGSTYMVGVAAINVKLVVGVAHLVGSGTLSKFTGSAMTSFTFNGFILKGEETPIDLSISDEVTQI